MSPSLSPVFAQWGVFFFWPWQQLEGILLYGWLATPWPHRRASSLLNFLQISHQCKCCLRGVLQNTLGDERIFKDGICAQNREKGSFSLCCMHHYNVELLHLCLSLSVLFFQNSTKLSWEYLRFGRVRFWQWLWRKLDVSQRQYFW